MLEWFKNSRSTQIVLAALVGLAIYNPVYSLFQLIRDVLREGLGIVGEVEWYLQPVYWIIAVVAILIVYYFYKKLDVANNEMPYFFIALLGVVVVNGLILAVDASWVHANLLSWRWFEWQIAPALSGCLMFAATQPKARLRQFGARSVNTDVNVNSDGAIDHDHEHDHAASP